MAPNDSCSGEGKPTARAKVQTSVINRRQLLDHDHIKQFISKHICGLIGIYNISGVKVERAWDIFCDIIFLNPVMTGHIS